MNNNKSGILLLNKPSGITSNQALQQVKRLLQANKAGHTGNLDPLASGVLPICLGEATKFAGLLLAADKSYIVTAKLGETTDTGDADGKIIATKSIPNLTISAVQSLLLRFSGKIQQLPPMYSALKHQGQPLYKLARRGIQVTRQLRDVTIYKITLLALEKEYLSLQVHCSKGTYIRTLLEDLGAELNCGAHITALCRTQAGPFTIEQTITMEKLQELLNANNSANQEDKDNEKKVTPDWLLPIDSAILHLPKIGLSNFAITSFIKGQQVAVNNAPAYGLVRVIADDSGQFIGIGEAKGNGIIAPKRLLANIQS